MMSKKFPFKNVLVTGGTGFVGSHLVEELINLEANIVTTYQTLDPLSYFSTQNMGSKVKMIQADISDFDKVFNIVTKFNIDFIFHLAAQPLVEVAYYNPRHTLATNILGTVNILEAARLFPKAKGVIVASSDKAYGKLDKSRYKETFPLKGDHPYEVSKSSADLIANAYFKTYKLPVIISRFGNIYGEGDLNFSRIIPGLMKALIHNKTLEIRSNGKYVRDYLYVKDVVRGYIELANTIHKVKGEAFNFGSNDTLSVLELINVCEKILNLKVKYKILNNAKNEIPYQSLDYSKIKKSIGWKPIFSIKKVLPQIFEWYKNTLNTI